ncbi:MAG: hypothetical protein PHI37_00625 [Candidatus Gracilibacteria bacterium]|nr:hypothetical protein [Candidatus Gracilibacteria bacterium]
MKKINGEIYYTKQEMANMLDKAILEQADILRKNLREKRNKNNHIREIDYV